MLVVDDVVVVVVVVVVFLLLLCFCWSRYLPFQYDMAELATRLLIARTALKMPVGSPVNSRDGREINRNEDNV